MLSRDGHTVRRGCRRRACRQVQERWDRPATLRASGKTPCRKTDPRHGGVRVLREGYDDRRDPRLIRAARNLVKKTRYSYASGIDHTALKNMSAIVAFEPVRNLNLQPSRPARRYEFGSLERNFPRMVRGNVTAIAWNASNERRSR